MKEGKLCKFVAEILLEDFSEKFLNLSCIARELINILLSVHHIVGGCYYTVNEKERACHGSVD
jgi:hypothetical protein